MSFRKILIANRGEIACRIARSAHRLGYRTVAVYSDADARALHVQGADEAVRLGPAAASESYLNIDAVLGAARRTGADAIHPGYGFLSERADFAQACVDAGLVFIGPPPDAMRAMGDKARAKQHMLAAGVPCAPGFMAAGADDALFQAEAERLGFPLLVKAVAGGGGRGMRLARSAADLVEALAGARREARSAFGDEQLMLERLIEHGRHIEVQVFADQHGHCIHLGERDCSAQRRRQKVIEESPSPIVDEDLRQRMGHDAVTAALAVGYQGAGTVEFIVDAERRHFFLEMNTRLQVEHPVTECVTGLDLVEWQLRVARGEPLPLTQDQVRFDGHAIEARLYAEDPTAGWLPQTGRILRWRPHDASVRIDHGICEGDEIGPHYDAMVAKFIAHGRNRDDAIRRLTRALADAPLFGLKTNAAFLCGLLNQPDFVDGRMTTTRLDEWAAARHAVVQSRAPSQASWRIAAALLAGDGLAFDLTLECNGDRRTLRTPIEGVRIDRLDAGILHCEIDGVGRRLPCAVDGRAAVHLAVDGAVHVFTEPSPFPVSHDGADPSRVCATTAGVVTVLEVRIGDAVVAGQALACIESMKMEMWLNASAAGTVRALAAGVGQSVAAGGLIVELELKA